MAVVTIDSYSRNGNNPSLIVFIKVEYDVFFNLGLS